MMTNNSMVTREAVLARQLLFLKRYARTFQPLDPDDLVQDTICRALQRWHLRFDGTNDRGWLGAIMHNLAVNRLKGVRDTTELDERILPCHAPRQFGFAHASEVWRRAQGLPDGQRDVVRLIGMGETYVETAGALGIPIGTVMSRLCRARRSLQMGD